MKKPAPGKRGFRGPTQNNQHDNYSPETAPIHPENVPKGNESYPKGDLFEYLSHGKPRRGRGQA